MDRSPGRCCCNHRSLLQRLRTRMCLALSLPSVSAATMYKRLTPTESTENEDSSAVQDATVEDINKASLDLLQEDLKESVGQVVDGERERLSSGVKGEIALKLLAQRAEQTPWERIKDAYTLDLSTRYCPLEYFDLWLTSSSSFFIGFLYGGYPALRLGKKRYQERSQGAAYQTRFHAVSDSVSAGNRGLIRYGMRWGWRVMFIATSFHGISTLMSLYRNKVDIWNYGTAAFTTGAMYRFNMGLKGMVGSGVAGLVIGIPAACSLLLYQRLSGVNTLERSIQFKAERLQDWYTDIESYKQGNADAIEIMDMWLKETDTQKEEEEQIS